MNPTMQDLSAAVTAAATRNRDGLVALLGKHNVKRASELPQDKWAALVVELNALLTGTHGAAHAPKSQDELRERLNDRLDWAEGNYTTTYDGKPDKGLLVGDTIITEGEFKGWTEREKYPPHWYKAKNHLDYVFAYWRVEWYGGTCYEKREIETKIRTREMWEKPVMDKFGPPGDYKKASFEGFNEISPELADARDAARDWVDSKDSLTLLLAGPVGAGKTHLAAAVYREALSVNLSCQFISATSLVLKFQEQPRKKEFLFNWYGGGNGDPDDKDDAGCIALLVIDDIALKITDNDKKPDIEAQILCEILERRTSKKLRTVFTTNANNEELEPWLGPRGFSRLQSRLTVVPVVGDDYRLKQ